VCVQRLGHGRGRVAVKGARLDESGIRDVHPPHLGVATQLGVITERGADGEVRQRARRSATCLVAEQRPGAGTSAHRGSDQPRFRLVGPAHQDMPVHGLGLVVGDSDRSDLGAGEPGQQVRGDGVVLRHGWAACRRKGSTSMVTPDWATPTTGVRRPFV